MTGSDGRSLFTLLQAHVEGETFQIERTLNICFPEPASKIVADLTGELIVAYNAKKVFTGEATDCYFPGNAENPG